MDHGFPYGAVSVIYFLVISISISLLVMQSDGRYLRPSDHGLAYQNSSIATKDDVPEMLSFFNGGKTASFKSNSDIPLPAASSSSGNSTSNWWTRHRKSHDNTVKDRLRDTLLLASLVCGLTGVLLLVFSASVFVFRYRKQQQQQKKMEVENQRTLPSPVPETSTPPSTLALVSAVVMNDKSSTK